MSDSLSSPPNTLLQRIVVFGHMIRFSHTVFALPFALVSMLLAAGGAPRIGTLFWVIVAMVGARSGAMGFNRLADARIDAANPRTAQREIPAGAISPGAAWVFIIASFALLVFASWMLNPLCLRLSPLAIAIVCFYSYTKRFTAWSHLFLGAAIGIAPIGAWIAVTGEVGGPSILLGLAVMCWIGGFDILYSLQDEAFDRSYGLHSVPARFGSARAVRISRALHLAMIAVLLPAGLLGDAPGLYYLGLAVVAVFLVWEHRLVRPNDLSRLDMAFFNMNAYISVAFFALVAIGYAIA